MTVRAPDWDKLDAQLRAAGFKIGPAQHIEAQQLLDGLRRTSIDTAGPETLAHYLGPLYCASPTQQSQFPELLRKVLEPGSTTVDPPPLPSSRMRWALFWRGFLGLLVVVALFWSGQAARYYMAPVAIEGRVTTAGKPLPGADVQLLQGTSQLQVALAGESGKFKLQVHRLDLPLTVTAKADGYLPSSKTLESLDGVPLELSLTQPPLPLPPPSGKPPSGFVLSFTAPGHTEEASLPLTETVTRVAWGRLTLVLIPGLLLMLWCAWWYLRRKAWLVRLPDRTPRSMQDLSASARRSLALVLRWGESGHELRRRQWMDSRELNVEATLDAICRQGAPRLVFGTRVEPEYVALVDESSQLDHLARLADEMLLALENADIVIRRFFFRGSPTRCQGPALERRPRTSGLPAVELEELLGRHRGARVIVISDGAVFFEQVTGYPQPWVPLLLGAGPVTVFTPARRGLWGRREWALFELGFDVLPLTPEGLAELGELYGMQRPLKTPGTASLREAPLPWIHQPARWLLPIPHVAPAEFGQELRAHLGDDVFLLLQAAAVYPEIHWGMTVRMGARLLPAARLAEALPQLTQLPWFRQSQMPGWLRWQLARMLTLEQWSQVHSVLMGLLSEPGEIPLQIGTPMPLSWGQLLRKLFTPSVARAFVRLRRDRVFLSFLQGPSRPGPEAVERIKRLLFHQGLWSRGIRAIPVLLLGTVTTAALAWHWPPLYQGRVVSSHKQQVAARIKALAMPGGSDSPIVAVYDDGQVRQLDAQGQRRMILPRPVFDVGRIEHVDTHRFVVRSSSGEIDAYRLGEDGRWTGEPSKTREKAYFSTDGTVVTVTDVGGASRTYPTGEHERPLCAAFAPDGETLIAVFKARIRKFHFGTPPVVQKELISSRCITHQDGEFIAGWDDTRPGATRIWRFDLRNLVFEREFHVISRTLVTEAAISGNGRVVVTLSGSSTQVYDADSMSGPIVIVFGASVEHAAVSKDGGAVALALSDGTVQVLQRKLPEAPRRFVVSLDPAELSPNASAGSPSTAAGVAGILEMRFGFRALLMRQGRPGALRPAIQRFTDHLLPGDELVIIDSRSDAERSGDTLESMRSQGESAPSSMLDPDGVLKGVRARALTILTTENPGPPFDALDTAPGTPARLLLSIERIRRKKSESAAVAAANRFLAALTTVLQSASGPTNTSQLAQAVSAVLKTNSRLVRARVDAFPTGSDESFIFVPTFPATDTAASSTQASQRPPPEVVPPGQTSSTVPAQPSRAPVAPSVSATLNILSGSDVDPDGGYDLVVDARPGAPTLGLGSVRVDVNEELGVFALSIPPSGGVGRQHLVLRPGVNKVVVRMRNADNTSAGETTAVVNLPVPDKAPSLHILSIGVGMYSRGILDPRVAQANAQRVAASFLSAAKQLYSSVDVVTLLGPQATRERVLFELDSLSRRTVVGDRVVIYLSAPWQTDGKVPSIVLFPANGNGAVTSLLPVSEFRSAAATLASGNLMFIVDGQLQAGRALDTGLEQEELSEWQMMANREGSFSLIAAALPSEVNSVAMTNALVQGLQGVAAVDTGRIDTNSLSNYVTSRVSAEKLASPEGAFAPKVFASSTGPGFVLGKRQALPTPDPPTNVSVR